jgi:hypothetical protein
MSESLPHFVPRDHRLAKTMRLLLDTGIQEGMKALIACESAQRVSSTPSSAAKEDAWVAS